MYVKNPKGYYRTLWVKTHPDVRAVGPTTLAKNAKQTVQKCQSHCSKSAIGLNQKCATTINTTIKDTIKDTTDCRSADNPATPSPLPAGGQAPALLAERKKQSRQRIEQFKRTLGKKPYQKWQPLTPEQFQQRKNAQLKALKGLAKLTNEPSKLPRPMDDGRITSKEDKKWLKEES